MRAAGTPYNITDVCLEGLPITSGQAQTPAATGLALAAMLSFTWNRRKRPGENATSQGIWTDEFDTPLQRPAKYANQEFFAEAQREDLDQERSVLLGDARPTATSPPRTT
jgi:hypothetical protein